MTMNDLYLKWLIKNNIEKSNQSWIDFLESIEQGE